MIKKKKKSTHSEFRNVRITKLRWMLVGVRRKNEMLYLKPSMRELFLVVPWPTFNTETDVRKIASSLERSLLSTQRVGSVYHKGFISQRGGYKSISKTVIMQSF